MIKKVFNYINLDCIMPLGHEISNHPTSGNLYLTPEGTFKFEQTVSRAKCYERNPHLFEGEYINIGRSKDGDIIINFRKIRATDSAFNAQTFCKGVFNELLSELPSIVNQ